MIAQAKQILKSVLRFPADLFARLLVTTSKELPTLLSRPLLQNPMISAKFFPHEPKRESYVIQKPEQLTNAENPDRVTGLPMPPRELWTGYGPTAEIWLERGKQHVDRMLDIVQTSGFALKAGHRILEVGCASGRMLRWLHDFAEDCEIWGIDISAPHITWCRHYLSPPFRFVTVTSLPHVPFEDNFFDFVYAGSVFTHIADLGDTWLMELRRIMRPGGRLYVTIHDRHTIDYLADKMPDFSLTRKLRTLGKEFVTSDFGLFAMKRKPGDAQVFHDVDYVRKDWGQFFSVVSITEEAFGYQTAVLLEKARKGQA